MRSRLAAVPIVVLLALLALALLAPALAGALPFTHDHLRLARHLSTAWGSQDARAFDPLGPFVLSGTVTDLAGSPVDGDVMWGSEDPASAGWYDDQAVWHYGGQGAVDGGTFTFPAVTSVPGQDDVFVYWYDTSSRTDLYLDSWGLDFSLGQPLTIRPGAVEVRVLNAPRSGFLRAISGDPAFGEAGVDIWRSASDILTPVPPPGFRTLEVRLEDGRGTDRAAVGWGDAGQALVPVGPGETAPQTITLDWSDAVRGELAGPVCRHSGPAGSTIRFKIRHWPAGMQVSFWGVPIEHGAVAGHAFPERVTSEGVDHQYLVPLTIPPDAPVGIYIVDAYRSDDPVSLLDVYDYFLVCEFRATESLIASGEQVRLHGQVEGNEVTLFKRTAGPAPQPSKYSAPGWTKVRSFETYGKGRFRTGFLRPGRTTWYVARYSGGDFPAFTQVVKVEVRDH